jgi:hypothetical protein
MPEERRILPGRRLKFSVPEQGHGVSAVWVELADQQV